MFSKIALIARYLLGVMFTVFGANGLMMSITGAGFIPMPPPPPEMMVVMSGFMATGYLMALVAALQFIAGIIFLSGRYVNLGIIFLGPIVLNILLIHVFAERSGLFMGIFVFVLFTILVKSRWEDFRVVLKK